MDVPLENIYSITQISSLSKYNNPEPIKIPRREPGRPLEQAHSGEAVSRTTTRKIMLQNIFVNITQSFDSLPHGTMGVRGSTRYIWAGLL